MPELSVVFVVTVPFPWNDIVISDDVIKLDPVTFTVLPVAPPIGLIAIDDVVTVNVCESEFVPSVAVTVWSPFEEPPGTLNEATKPPVPLAMAVATVPVPWNDTVIADDAMKLEPVTVTAVPAGPSVGLIVIDAGAGVDTRNVLSPVLKNFVSLAFLRTSTSIWCVPGVSFVGSNTIL